MAVTGLVCYCPELRLYSYKVDDDSKPDEEGNVDLKFNDDELEDAIATHLAQEHQQEAQFMAQVTGLARTNPHKFVRFSSESQEIAVIDPSAFWRDHDKAREEGLSKG